MLFYEKKNGGAAAMELAGLLGIQPGITAMIGGGGKNTLLRTLGHEPAQGPWVLLLTTTKILSRSGRLR